jgi:hypothetical protein
MKKILLAALFLGTFFSAMAGTKYIYVEDWGSTNSPDALNGSGNMNIVGWSVAAPAQTTGPYVGIFYATAGPTDPASGEALPKNTAFFSGFPNNSLPGIIYTTDASGSGSGGDSSFTDINPTLYTNLTLSVEVNDTHAGDTNYFAVQVGGQWYVATSFQFPTSLSYPQFTNVSLIYTNSANVWQALTINSSSVTIGGVASPNLNSTITGVGIVELPTGNGFDYNLLTITAGSGSAAPIPASITAAAVTPQYSYVGGGASFAINAAGTPPLTYIWETNGVPIGSDPRFTGTTNNYLTIENLGASDSSPGVLYSVIVTNAGGAATNGSLSLLVSNVAPSQLFAEGFDYVGPTGSGNLALSTVGWVASASAGSTYGIYQDGGTGGIGDVYAYSPTATTNIYYTTDTNDTGFSGLPFTDINPANYPTITFEAGFVPGNGAGQVSGAVSVYWAVAMNGTWYCSVQPQSIDLSSLSPFKNYQYGFNPAATNWNTVTVTGAGAIIGGRASSTLTGNITGAGLVIAHNTSNGSSMNYQNFQIITNGAVGIPPVIGTNVPLSVTVASGGGASFGVATVQGTPPFTYGWTTNGTPVYNGNGVFGATTPTLTLANLNSNDDGMVIIAYVTNSAGSDYSQSTLSYVTTLTVTNPAIGVIYDEAFPFVGPVAGNYPLSGVGWVEAAPSAPNALYEVTPLTTQGAAFAYLGAAGATVYYATTATDTNQSGLPFPNINLAGYQNMTFSVDIAPSFAATNVTAYLAVQLNGTNWYVAASALPVPTSVDSSTFATYSTVFNPAAVNWKNLTVTSAGGIIGAPVAGNLKGVMTGAGLVFVTVRSGGNFNFANFVITGTGLGGINVGPPANGSANLTWVGNPAVKLQSNTNLLNSQSWQDVPNSYGLYSLPVSTTGPRKFFRLTSP